MLYILLALALLYGVLYRLTPAQHAAHAARAKKVPFWALTKRRSPLMGPLKDETGAPVDIRGKYFGYVYGQSLADLLPHGTTFVATYLDSESRGTLKAGDIVVVDAPANYSRIKKRLRVFQGVGPEGLAEFRPDASGDHTPRPLDTILARVDWTSRSRRNRARAFQAGEPSSHVATA